MKKAILDSVTPATCAMLALVTLFATLVAGLIEEVVVGQPSSTAMVSLFITFFAAPVVAGLGAFLGMILQDAFGRADRRPTTNRRVVITGLLLVGVGSALVSVGRILCR